MPIIHPKDAYLAAFLPSSLDENSEQSNPHTPVTKRKFENKRTARDSFAMLANIISSFQR